MRYVKIFGKKYASDYESMSVTCKTLFKNTIKYVEDYNEDEENGDGVVVFHRGGVTPVGGHRANAVDSDKNAADKASRVWFYEIVSKELGLLKDYYAKFYG